MMSAIASLAGWVGAHAKEVVGLVAFSTALVWTSVEVDRWLREDATATAPVVMEVDRPARSGDLPDVTKEDRRTEYEAPDSSDTFTDCFRLPSAIFDSTAARLTASESPTPSRQRETGSSDTSKTTLNAHTTSFAPNMDGPGYGIIPMTSGRPRVSVESDLVTVPVFGRRGALTKYEYDVPRDTWRLSLGLDAHASQDAAVASTSLQGRRRTALGWVGVGPAYSAVVTNGGARTGLGVTVSFESTLWSR